MPGETMQKSTYTAENQAFRESWDGIIDSSRAMHDLAKEEDWAAINHIAVDRHRKITEHFRLFPVAPERASFYQQHLADFLAGERDLQRLAVTARESVMRSSIKANSNRKAVSAYHQSKR